MIIRSIAAISFLINLSFYNAEILNDEKKVSIDSIKKHIFVLADDSMQGRGTGYKGSYSAADYIASQLAEYKLQPGNNGESFFQQIPFKGILPQSNSELLLHNNTQTENLSYEKDYLIYSSGTESYLPVPVPMVFVGFGIVAPEYDYNDYQSVDVEGKIVVFLSGEPLSEDEKYFSGKDNTFHILPEVKQRIALSRGAKGTIMILNPLDNSNKDWEHFVHQYSFEEVTLAYTRTENLALVFNFNRIDKLLLGSANNSSQILEMISTHSIKSFPLNTKMSYKGKSRQRNFTSPNIIALKKGRDPALKDSYILLSAHYDHLGIGKAVNDDSVYNGFIDNASGVAALLEIARALKDTDTKRSIIFLFTTAEEKGLLGSQYYVDNPLFPLFKTVANINTDGLAFLDGMNSITCVGGELSSMGEMLDSVLVHFKMRQQDIPLAFNKSESFSNSDQFSFAKAGIPAVILAEGTDFKTLNRDSGIKNMIFWMENIYHSPFDNVQQQINYSAMQQHAEIILSYINFLTNNPSQPEWKEGIPFINARLNSIAEKR